MGTNYLSYRNGHPSALSFYISFISAHSLYVAETISATVLKYSYVGSNMMSNISSSTLSQ